MTLKVYNTLSRKQETFKPRSNQKVQMFVCGPTVYDYSHIGHARSYIVFDVLAKYLRYKGYKVSYIQNITDIDDRIIDRASKTNKDPQKLAKEFEESYYEDVAALGINAVDKYLPASKHIPEIVSQIQRLIKKSYAYVAEDGVWFNVPKFKDYGKLSRQKPEELHQHRIEPSPNKKSHADFALWKKQKPGEPFWDSPWGRGRPGWHIEDTAITEKYFGPQYDIHGGGQDLIFPHHEAEIAQIEAVSGKKPLVKYWLHNGFLLVKGQKMAKSLGNFVTIRDALQKHKPQVLRLFFSATHYRASIDYSEAALENSEKVYAKFENFILRLKRQRGGKQNKEVGKFILKLKKDFEKEMDSDFNIAGALLYIHDFINRVNSMLDSNSIGQTDAKEILKALYDLDAVLSLGFEKIEEAKVPKGILSLIREREEARQRKDFKTSDKIRQQLAKKGIILEDSDTGTRWKITQTHK